MSSLSLPLFINASEKTLYNEYNSIMDCTYPSNNCRYSCTYSYENGLKFTTDNIDWEKRTDLCKQAIHKCNKIMQEIELFDGLNEMEKNQLDELRANVTHLSLYFKTEQSFSHSYHLLNSYVSPLNKLSIKIAAFSIPTFVLTSCIYTLTHQMREIALISGAINGLLLIPAAINVGWSHMTQKHIKVAINAYTLIKSIELKIKNSTENDCLASQKEIKTKIEQIFCKSRELLKEQNA